MRKENRLVWPRLWAIRSARLPKRSAGRSRRSRASSRATSCRAGAIRRFTPPEPINCAGGVKRGSKEIEPYGPSLSTGWLKGGNEPRLRAVGCETIYAFIYRTAQQAEQLWRYLTRHHKRRRPRRSRPSQDTIKDRVSIHERPKKVDARTA